ncbi:MAG: hypothetical protein KDA71_23575, partial [Planctomycetales bacterium]|nr:hypothetical protein [Planctomycetales bacterium]
QVDLIVGGLAEEHVAGAMVGPLFHAIIRDQFLRTRDGDRFWFENGQFAADDLDAIRATTLADVILRNTDVATIADDVFIAGAAPLGPLAGGSAADPPPTESRSIDGRDNNPNDVALGSAGQNLLLNYTLEYGDGISEPAGANRPSARSISNAVFAQDASTPNARGATTMLMIWGQLLAHDIALTPGGADNTLKIHGESFAGPETYPFVAEKLPLLYDRDIYPGVDNVIDRPIFLPALDVAGGTIVDPMNDTMVTQEIAPGEFAEVYVEAGTLQNRDGTMFDGTLSITEVPRSLTPAALPAGLSPDTVVTIQPAEMVFSTPAPLTLPNRGGWSPFTEMDLWSIDPVTGEFAKVGTGFVSFDGSVIETVDGGIRNSSWHFWSPPEIEWIDPTTEKERGGGGGGGGLPGCQVPRLSGMPEDTHMPAVASFGDLAMQPQSSLASDKTDESHAKKSCTRPEALAGPGKLLFPLPLSAYRSKGVIRGVSLEYDSLRAAPTAMLGIGVENAAFAPSEDGLVASAKISRGSYSFAVPGDGPDNQHYWSLPAGESTISAGLPVEMSTQPTGVYKYEIQASSGRVLRDTNGDISVREATELSGRFAIVNSVTSVFGAGWGLAGLQEVIEGPDNSLLL